MKRYLYTYMLLAVAAVGCDKAGFDDDQSSEGARELRQVVISATADSRETKTSVDEAGKVYWSPSDHLGVFFFKELYQFTSINNEQASSADFVGNVAIVGGTNEGFESSRDGYSYWAVYPYNSDAVCDGSSVTTTLSGKQYAKAGTFSDDTFLSVSRSTDYSQFNFHNVSGGLCFSVTGEDIQTVKFRGNNGETLAGTVKIAYNEDGVPVVEEVVSSVTEIVLNAPYGETFEPGEMYYLTALPAVLSEGFTMTFCQSNSSMVAERVVNASVTIRRNVFGRLTNADSGLEYVDSGVYNTVYPHPANNQVYYKSLNNKPVFVDWSAQLGNVMLSNVYNPELGYCVVTFKDDVLSISASGDGEYITEIILPDELEKINNSAFSEYYNLSHVVFPSKLKRIGVQAFMYSGLESLELPAGLMTIADGAFNQCPISGTVNVHNANVMAYAFCCSGIQTFIAEEGCQYICSSAFSDCEELTSVEIRNRDLLTEPGFLCGVPLTSISGAYFDTFGDYAIVDGVLSFVKPGVETVDLTGQDIQMAVWNVFSNRDSLKSLVLPDLFSATSDWPPISFAGCTNLISIYAPNLSCRNWEGMFADCESLESLTMDSLENTSLMSCKSLQNLKLNSIVLQSWMFDLTTLDLSACGCVTFNSAPRIENLILPGMSIPEGTFNFDDVIKTLTIKGTCEIGARAFCGSPLQTLIIEDGDLSFSGEEPFANCPLDEIVFDEGHGVSGLVPNVFANTYFTTLHFEALDNIPEGNIPETIENLYLSPGTLVNGVIQPWGGDIHYLNVYVNGDDPICFPDDNPGWGGLDYWIKMYIPSTARINYLNAAEFWQKIKFYDIETGESLDQE